jgi:phosphohistidine phosphatase
MRLYLVQHGDALTKDVDPERPLSAQGRADIIRLATWLVDDSVVVSRILHSGKMRARQTAELLEPVLDRGSEISPVDGLGPNDPPEAFLRRLDYVDEDTLIASHLPFVARVVAQAVTGSPDQPLVEFRPGSLAVIERDSDGAWQLICFICPGFFQPASLRNL